MRAGDPLFSFLCLLRPLPWFIFPFFFPFSADPSPSLTGAQGPHSLANTSRVPFFFCACCTLCHLVCPFSFSSFFFSADPLPFSHRCIGTPLACKREWAFPIFTDLHLPCPFARKREARCCGQLVRFFTFTFSFTDRPFSLGNPLLLVLLSCVAPVASSSCHPCLRHVAMSPCRVTVALVALLFRVALPLATC
jgi:hypothetical protein